MGDIYIGRNEDGELVHSAKGTTWQSKNAAYIARVKKNGKWVYTYASNKAGKAAKAATGAVVGAATGAANKAVGAYKSYNSTASKVNRSMARDRRANATKKAIAKGKAKVNELLERMRKSAKITRAKVVNAKLNRDYKKKYVTNRERDVKRAEKRAEAKRQQAAKNRTRLYKASSEAHRRGAYYTWNPEVNKAYDNGERGKTYEEFARENKKRYKKQAQAQKKTKRTIAREQAVGKAKKTANRAKTTAVSTANSTKRKLKAAQKAYKSTR